MNKHIQAWTDNFLKDNQEEALAVMEEAKRRREANAKSTGAVYDNSMRGLGCLPIGIIRGMEKQFGRHIWKDKKFVREFYDTYKVFKACEKI